MTGRERDRKRARRKERGGKRRERGTETRERDRGDRERATDRQATEGRGQKRKKRVCKKNPTSLYH